jgi:hypothetical protein
MLYIFIIYFIKVTAKPHQIGVWDPLVCGTRDPPPLPTFGFEPVTNFSIKKMHILICNNNNPNAQMDILILYIFICKE